MNMMNKINFLITRNYNTSEFEIQDFTFDILNLNKTDLNIN